MKALLHLITVGVDLTAEQRLWVRVAVLTILVAGCTALYAAGRWDVVEQYDLIGVALTIAGALVGLGQTVARQSRRPLPPQRALGREETNPRLPLSLPREATGPQPLPVSASDWPPGALPELTEDDIDTERPPADLDDDHDTDPQTPLAKQRRQS